MINVYRVGTVRLSALSSCAVVTDARAQSCGYGIPFYTFKAPRNRLIEFCKKKEAADIEAEINLEPSVHAVPPRPEDGLKHIWMVGNTKSVDGLPGMVSGYKSVAPFMRKDIVLKTDNEGVPVQWWGELRAFVEPKVVIAFGLGILVSTTYGKFIRGLVALVL